MGIQFNFVDMEKLTPMMRQYMEIKEQYQDAILMFRLGDFFEMFFEDAVLASNILQITLTARNKKGKGEPIPMCGIPHHALEGYLAKLTKAGKKVALCDQVTEPNGKGIVEREVVRIITPGTTFDDKVLDQKANNYVASIEKVDSKYQFAYADITTGEFRATEIAEQRILKAEIVRIGPAECVVKEYLMEEMKGLLPEQLFFISEEGEGAQGILKAYLQETQKDDLSYFGEAQIYQRGEFMPLDESLMRNLEIFFNNHDGKKVGSLLGVMDETVCALGGRMLRRNLMYPLLDKALIEKRLDAVEKFSQDSSLLRKVREELSGLYDIERLMSRLALGTGNARDLLAIARSLEVVKAVKEIVKDNFPRMYEDLDPLEEVLKLILDAIKEEPAAVTNTGGMIREGYDSDLDALLSLRRDGKTFIAELQEREAKRTGIGSLKVKFNKVFGYYIEISKANLAAVPEDYIRKQTLVNSERFITPELKEYEEKVLNADEQVKELEYKLFYEVRMKVVEKIKEMQKNADVLGRLDVFSALAFLAVKRDYVRPDIGTDGVIDIKEGRHPVVEALVSDFISNDCQLTKDSNLVVLTGPNMGGKSTFLRQVALMVLMAQIGSFVPAREAKISLTDRIFTRIGASDNLAKGQSTFMVEMTEASQILSEATSNSLVILDELGRGTSTYDGVSIAFAVTEYLHDVVRAKTLFATHYHELIELGEDLSRGKNMSVLVKENEEEGVVFLYKVVDGAVDKSYGIEVAKLAGLPASVVNRAKGVMAELEEKHVAEKPYAQTMMFEQREHVSIKEREVYDELMEMDINNMTPLEVMQKIMNLKNK